jgi:hypothetical protein
MPPLRVLLGSVVPQGYSSAKLEREEIFDMDTTKIIELPGRSGLVPRLEGSNRR